MAWEKKAGLPHESNSEIGRIGYDVTGGSIRDQMRKLWKNQTMWELRVEDTSLTCPWELLLIKVLGSTAFLEAP